MNKFHKLMTVAVTGLSMVSLTGCVDDAYDLENINSDVEVKVNDLVVPIKLDAITLSNVFDLDPESVIKEIDGEYAVVVDGDFQSEKINVAPVEIVPGEIQPIHCMIYKYEGSDVNLPVAAQTVSYLVTEVDTEFSFRSDVVDKTIRDLKKVKSTWNIDVKLDITDNNGLFSTLSFQQLVLKLPEGMHVSNFPCKDGLVSVGDIDVNIGGETVVTLVVDEIDCTKFDSRTYSFTPAPGDENNGSLSFNGRVGIASGYVVGGTASTSTSIPQNVELTVAPAMDRINIKSVTGTIAYNITGFNVADIELNDLPDMLHQDGTDVVLKNPQLYLSLNNPVANYGLEAASGLTLTSKKNGNDVNNCSLDAGAQIELDSNLGVVGPYKFCLSPEKPESFYQGFADSKVVGYKSLSYLLSGSGLPDYVHVTFDNPRVLPGEVTDFMLDTQIDGLDGVYTLFAPLEFAVNSQIVYEEEETGWNDETLSKVVVSSLKVNASVVNSLPMDIVVSGVPLGVDGKPCVDPNTKKPVKLEGIRVAAGTTAPIELHSTGTIVGLDGIRYNATCVISKEGQVLKPTETIELKNIRATVNGYYRDEL